MINKTDILNKLNKYKNKNKYFFEDIKFRFFILIFNWFLYTTWVVLFIFNMSFRGYIFYPAILTTIILTSINTYTRCKNNNKITIIANELNIRKIELKYLIKKYELNGKL